MINITTGIETLRKMGFVINSLAHLGANQAQGREEYRKNGINKLLWVEALPHLVNSLQVQLKNCDDIILQGVLSDKTGEIVEFNIASNNAMSSSIFEFNKHSMMYPSIKMTDSVTLTTTTFDDLIEKNNVVFDYDISVLDLQGAELKTLIGASHLLKRSKAIICEVSCIELYKDAPLEKDIDQFMSNNNFYKLMSAYTEYGWGESLYVKGNNV